METENKIKIRTDELIDIIQEKSNPISIASHITYYILDNLKEGSICLYEAYSLNGEVIQLDRMGYTQSAWHYKVYIRTCITFINQRMLALLFNDMEYAHMIKKLAMETKELNTEKRPHAIMDNFEQYLEIENHEELLRKIECDRKNYDNLSDDDGPFLNEVFPFHFFEPEKFLLSKETFREEKKLSKEVEDIIVEVGMKW